MRTCGRVVPFGIEMVPFGVAETLSKAALLSGPDRARDWLTHGGVVVCEDGAFEVVEPADD